MNEHLVFWIVLGACCCGAVIAVGLVVYAARVAEQEEGRFR